MSVQHLRAQGIRSTNPLLNVMYDKRAMVVPADDSGPHNALQMTRTRGDMQVKLLEELVDEDFDQVQRRVKKLQSQLSSVNQSIQAAQADINSAVTRASMTAAKRTALPQRDIAPALSTFNWTNEGTTSASQFQWNSPIRAGRHKYTTQWGDMSKYGDDPCVIMMNHKQKEQFEARRRLKKTGTLI